MSSKNYKTLCKIDRSTRILGDMRFTDVQHFGVVVNTFFITVNSMTQSKNILLQVAHTSDLAVFYGWITSFDEERVLLKNKCIQTVNSLI